MPLFPNQQTPSHDSRYNKQGNIYTNKQGNNDINNGRPPKDLNQMPITSDRMTALIRAAQSYQTKEIHLGKIIQSYLALWSTEIIPHFNSLETTPEVTELFTNIKAGIDNLLDQVQRPVRTEHISTIAGEEAHFNARAHANAASRRYMERSRSRKRADWPNQPIQLPEPTKPTFDDMETNEHWFAPCDGCKTVAKCVPVEICMKEANNQTNISKPTEQIKQTTEDDDFEEYVSQNPNPTPTIFTIGKKETKDA